MRGMKLLGKQIRTVKADAKEQELRRAYFDFERKYGEAMADADQARSARNRAKAALDEYQRTHKGMKHQYNEDGSHARDCVYCRAAERDQMPKKKSFDKFATEIEKASIFAEDVDRGDTLTWNGNECDVERAKVVRQDKSVFLDVLWLSGPKSGKNEELKFKFGDRIQLYRLGKGGEPKHYSSEGAYNRANAYRAIHNVPHGSSPPKHVTIAGRGHTVKNPRKSFDGLVKEIEKRGGDEKDYILTRDCFLGRKGDHVTIDWEAYDAPTWKNHTKNRMGAALSDEDVPSLRRI